MIIRQLDEVTTVEWGNGLSRRFLLESDGLGYSVTDTTVRAGTKSRLEYRRHLETCYCVEGTGSVIDADGVSHPLSPGTLYALDQHDAHFLLADPGNDLRLICMFTPALTGSETHSLDSSEFSQY